MPFRRNVPVAFLGREELAAYLREVFDEEYPKEQARADERLLEALDLLPPGTDLRALRAASSRRTWPASTTRGRRSGASTR